MSIHKLSWNSYHVCIMAKDIYPSHLCCLNSEAGVCRKQTELPHRKRKSKGHTRRLAYQMQCQVGLTRLHMLASRDGIVPFADSCALVMA